MSVRVLLVESQRIVREGIRSLFAVSPGIEVVGESGESEDAISQTQKLDPDVVVINIHTPTMNGFETTKTICRSNHSTKVIGLDDWTDKSVVQDILQVGAKGYVLKQSGIAELREAISTVMDGGTYLSTDVKNYLVNDFIGTMSPPRSSSRIRLSSRETEILRLIADGNQPKQISQILSIGLKTAETHRRNILKKLKMKSVAELVKYAVREGITTL